MKNTKLIMSLVALCSIFVMTTLAANEISSSDLDKQLFSVLLDKSNKESKQDQVQSLIQQGAQVNAEIKHNSLTYTPLYAAVLTGDVALVSELLQAGATESINKTVMGPDSATPLHTAIRRNMPDMVKLLLENGADQNLTVFSSMSAGQVTAPQLAQELGFSDIVALFNQRN